MEKSAPTMLSIVKRPRDDTLSYNGAPEIVQTLLFIIILPCPGAGRYMMAVGQLMDGGDLPIIRAMKLQDLTDCPALRDMWTHEVVDMRNCL